MLYCILKPICILWVKTLSLEVSFPELVWVLEELTCHQEYLSNAHNGEIPCFTGCVSLRVSWHQNGACPLALIHKSAII